MTLKRKPKKRLEDYFPDEKTCQEVKELLYSGDPLLGEGSIFTELLQSIVNASLEGEMDYFLSEEKKSGRQKSRKNRRNGHVTKSVKSTIGKLNIETPRDRNSDFEPVLIKKRERELQTGLDKVILSLYGRGQSIDDIREQLKLIYGLNISSGSVSHVTNRIWSDVLEWQQRPVSACYPVVYLDGIHFRVREDGKMGDKAIHTVYGVDVHGQRDVLGLYVEDSEGANNWGRILEDLKRRGLEEILFCCVDGLKGFSDVITEVFPRCIVQRCIVHMVRTSTRFVNTSDRKKVCADLRKIYTSANRGQAELALLAFGEKWDKKYPEIRKKWRKEWEDLMAFMDFGANIRRMIYTTNPVEAIHRIMRKVTKSKGGWVNEMALQKQLYLTLKYSEKSWKRKAFKWNSIQRELIVKFGAKYSRYLDD